MKLESLRWGIALVLFTVWAYAAPTVYGNVLKAEAIAFASFQTPVTNNKGGLLFDTTQNAVRISDGTEWVNQWQAGSAYGIKKIVSENVDGGTGSFAMDTVATFGAGEPDWHTLFAAGGGTIAGVDALGFVYSQQFNRVPVYGMSGAFVVGTTQKIWTLANSGTFRAEVREVAISVSVSGTGAGTFSFEIQHGLGGAACTVDFPCVMNVDEPTAVATSGGCIFSSSDYLIVTETVDGCTTPPTLTYSLDIDYLSISALGSGFPPNP